MLSFVRWTNKLENHFECLTVTFVYHVNWLHQHIPSYCRLDLFTKLAYLTLSYFVSRGNSLSNGQLFTSPHIVD